MIIQPHNIDDSPSARFPVLVHTLGIPGAGKSTFLNILRQNWNLDTPACLLGFDQIMMNMPEYQAISNTTAAFASCEIPARETGYRLLDNLINRRAHILFDNGGSAAHHLDLLQHAQCAGYQVIIVSLIVPLDLAQQRVDRRIAEENRTMPPYYLAERLQKISQLKPQYRNIADAFYELNNSDNNAALFHKKSIELVDNILQNLGMLSKPEYKENIAS